MRPVIQAFFDKQTFTVTYLVSDPASRRAVIIDPVLDFDPRLARTGTGSADRVLDHPALGRAAVESTIDLWAGHRAILSRRPDGRRGTCKSRRTSDRS